jgi:pimeloyl-ACP methyl ester carboxylesterase
MMIRRFLPLALALSLALVAWPCLADWEYQTVNGAGDVPLNVVTAGNPQGPAILLIHGIGQSHYSFARQLDSDLAEDYFLVAFDLRGHGASGKPWTSDMYDKPRIWADDVAAVITATGIDRPIIVAWSYGTLVFMDYLREFGVGNIAGVVLTGALGALMPFQMPTSDDPNAAEFARIRALQLSPDIVDNIRAGQTMIKWLTAAPIPEDDHALFEAISLMLPGYARRAMVQRRFDNQDLLERLTVPVLMSLGQEDNPAQLIDGAKMAETYSNMRLSVYESAGHSVFYEQPKRFNAELRQFAGRAQ